MNFALIDVLLFLQAFHVLFLALHDWVPLSPLNDINAVRAENSRTKLIVGTLISTVPFAAVFVASLFFLGEVYPRWLVCWLLISYALLFFGELQAWWYPYVFGAKPELVTRYDVMFGNTTAFLPARNDIRPNTLHVVLHLLTAITLIVILMLRH